MPKLKFKYRKTVKMAEFVHADLEYHEHAAKDAKESFKDEVSVLLAKLAPEDRKALNQEPEAAEVPTIHSNIQNDEIEINECFSLVLHETGEETQEIKVSIENGSGGQNNIVQIRPHHKITHYILVIYSVTKDEEFWLKVPSQELYELLPEFGGYAHGTVESQGPTSSIMANEFEYALRPSMFAGPKSKTRRLWNILLNYRTSVEELKRCL